MYWALRSLLAARQALTAALLFSAFLRFQRRLASFFCRFLSSILVATF